MLHTLFPDLKQTRETAVESLHAALREIAKKSISPTKRTVLTAAINYLINRYQTDDVVRLVMTDHAIRMQQILSIANSTEKNDDAFIQDVWRVINSLSKGSALKIALEQAVKEAQIALDARRSSAYQIVTGAVMGATALLILSDPKIGLPLLVLHLVAALYPAPVKRAFNELLEVVDAILSTDVENAGNPPRAPVAALR